MNPSEFGMMLGEPTHSSKECREKTTEIMFEKFKVPALYMAKNAVLSAFATAKQTALVVDAGHEATTGAARLIYQDENNMGLKRGKRRQGGVKFSASASLETFLFISCV